MSSKVMALMLSEARMASLSASVGSSLEGIFADRITHLISRNIKILKGQEVCHLKTKKYYCCVQLYRGLAGMCLQSYDTNIAIFSKMAKF